MDQITAYYSMCRTYSEHYTFDNILCATTFDFNPNWYTSISNVIGSELVLDYQNSGDLELVSDSNAQGWYFAPYNGATHRRYRLMIAWNATGPYYEYWAGDNGPFDFDTGTGRLVVTHRNWAYDYHVIVKYCCSDQTSQYDSSRGIYHCDDDCKQMDSAVSLRIRCCECTATPVSTDLSSDFLESGYNYIINGSRVNF